MSPGPLISLVSFIQTTKAVVWIMDNSPTLSPTQKGWNNVLSAEAKSNRTFDLQCYLNTLNV